MRAYFFRRILLIPFTLIGITALVFATIRLAPGGPVEQRLAQLVGGEKRSRAEATFSLTPAQVLEEEEKEDEDKGLWRAYFEWLGLAPRDLAKTGKEFPKGETEVKIPLPGTTHVVTVKRAADGTATLHPPDQAAGETPRDAPLPFESAAAAVESQPDLSKWRVRLRTPQEQAERWEKWVKGVDIPVIPEYRAILFKPGYDGLLQGSLGNSKKYQDSVWSMILARMPVSLYFGLLSMIAVYGICLPLGIVKAIRHRTYLDNASSVAVFAGYAVPGYALGSLLVVFLGAKLGWFPIRGFTGDDFENLSAFGKVKDVLHHTAMPLVCYLIGSFAFMTMMMKNNLMDNLAADYVRTAAAKGVSFPTAVFKHAFRNSIIPIATTFGNNVSLLVAGSMLIERVFDINGFGLLQFSAIVERDQPLIMGVLFFSALLLLVGNVLSDLCVALVDPRVSYK